MKTILDKYLLEIQPPPPAAKVAAAAGGTSPIILAITAATLVMSAYNFYKSNLTKAARYCSDFNGEEKTKCMTSYKLRAHRKLMADISASKSKCKDEKCKMAIDSKLEKLEDQGRELTQKLASIMNQNYGN